MGTKNIVTRNIFWSFCDRIGPQLVSFIVSIILARLLEPKDYGIVAIAMILQGILGVFVDSGMGGALVQKKKADDLDFSSVFYFSMVMCFLLYILVWIGAPFLAELYNMPQLTCVTRVTALSLFVGGGARVVLIAKIQRDLEFRKSFFATGVSTLCSAVAGLVMAYMGYGVWALVAQNLTHVTIGTICLWFCIDWRPRWIFSFLRLKGLIDFGWKILVASLFNMLYTKTRDLVIGKRYSVCDLAYYNKGAGWPHLLFANIGGAVESVTYSVFSRLQDDPENMRNTIGRTICLNSFVVMPMLVGLSICAPDLVRIVLTEKWLPSVLYLRIFCVVYAIELVANTNMNSIRAQGRSDLFLKTVLLKQIVDFCLIFATMRINVAAIAYSLILSNLIYWYASCYCVNKLFAFPFRRQVMYFLPSVFLSFGMAVSVLAFSFSALDVSIKLPLQMVVGAFIYILLAKMFRVEGYIYCQRVLETFLKKYSISLGFNKT